ncbi:hypothetical protein [Aestuariivirga sp.]|uniref:hypothetical protein n=1 Tax=Aestuariivirga sp. TaxID=2650926 RepID=UPI0030165FC8
MSSKAKLVFDDTDTAQNASKMLLTIANSHPPTIGMGALIMATSIAAREMNIPLQNIAAMLDRTLAEVYAVADVTSYNKIVN